MRQMLYSDVFQTVSHRLLPVRKPLVTRKLKIIKSINLLYLRFSQQCCWRFKSSIDVSKVRSAHETSGATPPASQRHIPPPPKSLTLKCCFINMHHTGRTSHCLCKWMQPTLQVYFSFLKTFQTLNNFKRFCFLIMLAADLFMTSHITLYSNVYTFISQIYNAVSYFCS